jgi:hypothetical protein
MGKFKSGKVIFVSQMVNISQTDSWNFWTELIKQSRTSLYKFHFNNDYAHKALFTFSSFHVANDIFRF